VIQSDLRTAPVMHGVVKDLSRQQVEAVVTFLEGLAQDILITGS
jgi:hypothetical protein